VPISAGSGDLTDVLSAADSACYAAKDQGRNRVHIFEPNDLALVHQRGEMQWLQRIRQALERARTQKQSSAQAAATRAGELDQKLQEVLQAETQLLGFKERIEASIP